jgi:hypothetical protein
MLVQPLDIQSEVHISGAFVGGCFDGSSTGFLLLFSLLFLLPSVGLNQSLEGENNNNKNLQLITTRG